MLKLQKFMKTKKGFTLVEVIVVLVILAILAAISIPSLTGYIDEAKDKALVAEARNAFVAAQAIASQEYAKPNATIATIKAAITIGEINKYVGATLTGTITVPVVSPKGTITEFTYKATATSKTVTFKDGKVTVA
ncbi:MAG: prepilin-type N-terminal cleavage/methylation domain-containing protein [Hydrogenoanaerobacterium sp.]